MLVITSRATVKSILECNYSFKYSKAELKSIFERVSDPFEMSDFQKEKFFFLFNNLELRVLY